MRIAVNRRPPRLPGQRAISKAWIVASASCGCFVVNAALGATSDPEDTKLLEEVIVTAQKREERLQDVPVPVYVLKADSLTGNNQLRLQDYYAKVPGVNLSFGNRGETFLAIRGLTAGGAVNPTVGFTVDEVPYGSSTALGGGFSAPDFDPSDLERVEVLRGPQGTLYGASSLGGLVKYVTVDPSTSGRSGRFESGVSSVSHGDGLGYTVRGAINVPLSEELAVRASGFTRRDPGYIDNPLRNQEGINERTSSGGRLSALWRPSDSFSIKLGALLQDSDTDGSPKSYKRRNLGDLQQDSLAGTGIYDVRKQLYDATMKLQMGTAELTSISSYSENELHDLNDFTDVVGPRTNAVYGVAATEFNEDNKTSKFTQEIRVADRIGDGFEWLLGGFYTHESSVLHQEAFAVNEATGARLAPQFLDSVLPTKYDEFAVFADLTFHLTERFDLQIGGRQSKNEQDFSQTNVGRWQTSIAGTTDPFVIPSVKSDDSSFTYLVTPRFKISPDLMTYARIASGYRPGGPNANSTSLGLPLTFKPDKTKNYEIGAKGSLFARVLSFDASIFRIDWDDIQLSVFDAQRGSSYTANVGAARSQGAELALEAHPLDGTRVALSGAYTDAEVTTAFPPPPAAVYGVSGNKLPYSARRSGSLSVEQELPLGDSLALSVGGTVSYVGERTGRFRSVPLRQTYPAYSQVDLHASFTLDAWSANLYVNNVNDKRGVLSGGLGDQVPFAYIYIQPRTVGLSLVRTF